MKEQEVVRSTRGLKQRRIKGKAKLTKKIAICLASIICCLSFVAVGVIASLTKVDVEIDNELHYYATAFNKDVNDFFLITSYDDLVDMSMLVNNGITIPDTDKLYSEANFKLMVDIDASGKDAFVPIGSNPENSQFKGEFNGNGHKIYNLSISSNSAYSGIFGYVNGAKIYGLGIGDSKAENQGVGSVNSTASYAGGIVGFACGDTEIHDCYNYSNVTSTSNYVGGIVGCVKAEASKSIQIYDCYNTGNLTGGNYVGGIVGCVDGETAGNVSINRTYSLATIETTTNSTSHHGGIVGNNLESRLTVSNSYYMSTGVKAGGVDLGNAYEVDGNSYMAGQYALSRNGEVLGMQGLVAGEGAGKWFACNNDNGAGFYKFPQLAVFDDREENHQSDAVGDDYSNHYGLPMYFEIYFVLNGGVWKTQNTDIIYRTNVSGNTYRADVTTDNIWPANNVNGTNYTINETPILATCFYYSGLYGLVTPTYNDIYRANDSNGAYLLAGWTLDETLSAPSITIDRFNCTGDYIDSIKSMTMGRIVLRANWTRINENRTADKTLDTVVNASVDEKSPVIENWNEINGADYKLYELTYGYSSAEAPQFIWEGTKYLMDDNGQPTNQKDGTIGFINPNWFTYTLASNGTYNLYAQDDSSKSWVGGFANDRTTFKVEPGYTAEYLYFFAVSSTAKRMGAVSNTGTNLEYHSGYYALRVNTATLPAPTNLYWSTGVSENNVVYGQTATANWNGVNHIGTVPVKGYTVSLFKEGEAEAVATYFVDAVVGNSASSRYSYDFKDELLSAGGFVNEEAKGKYYFTVTAVAGTANNAGYVNVNENGDTATTLPDVASSDKSGFLYTVSYNLEHCSVPEIVTTPEATEFAPRFMVGYKSGEGNSKLLRLFATTEHGYQIVVADVHYDVTNADGTTGYPITQGSVIATQVPNDASYVVDITLHNSLHVGEVRAMDGSITVNITASRMSANISLHKQVTTTDCQNSNQDCGSATINDILADCRNGVHATVTVLNGDRVTIKNTGVGIGFKFIGFYTARDGGMPIALETFKTSAFTPLGKNTTPSMPNPWVYDGASYQYGTHNGDTVFARVISDNVYVLAYIDTDGNETISGKLIFVGADGVVSFENSSEEPSGFSSAKIYARYAPNNLKLGNDGDADPTNNFQVAHTAVGTEAVDGVPVNHSGNGGIMTVAGKNVSGKYYGGYILNTGEYKYTSQYGSLCNSHTAGGGYSPFAYFYVGSELRFTARSATNFLFSGFYYKSGNNFLALPGVSESATSVDVVLNEDGTLTYTYDDDGLEQTLILTAIWAVFIPDNIDIDLSFLHGAAYLRTRNYFMAPYFDGTNYYTAFGIKDVDTDDDGELDDIRIYGKFIIDTTAIEIPADMPLPDIAGKFTMNATNYLYEGGLGGFMCLTEVAENTYTSSWKLNFSPSLSGIENTFICNLSDFDIYREWTSSDLNALHNVNMHLPHNNSKTFRFFCGARKNGEGRLVYGIIGDFDNDQETPDGVVFTYASVTATVENYVGSASIPGGIPESSVFVNYGQAPADYNEYYVSGVDRPVACENGKDYKFVEQKEDDNYVNILLSYKNIGPDGNEVIFTDVPYETWKTHPETISIKNNGELAIVSTSSYANYNWYGYFHVTDDTEGDKIDNAQRGEEEGEGGQSNKIVLTAKKAPTYSQTGITYLQFDNDHLYGKEVDNYPQLYSVVVINSFVSIDKVVQSFLQYKIYDGGILRYEMGIEDTNMSITVSYDDALDNQVNIKIGSGATGLYEGLDYIGIKNIIKYTPITITVEDAYNASSNKFTYFNFGGARKSVVDAYGKLSYSTTAVEGENNQFIVYAVDNNKISTSISEDTPANRMDTLCILWTARTFDIKYHSALNTVSDGMKAKDIFGEEMRSSPQGSASAVRRTETGVVYNGKYTLFDPITDTNGWSYPGYTFIGWSLTPDAVIANTGADIVHNDIPRILCSVNSLGQSPYHFKTLVVNESIKNGIIQVDKDCAEEDFCLLRTKYLTGADAGKKVNYFVDSSFFDAGQKALDLYAVWVPNGTGGPGGAEGGLKLVFHDGTQEYEYTLPITASTIEINGTSDNNSSSDDAIITQIRQQPGYDSFAIKDNDDEGYYYLEGWTPHESGVIVNGGQLTELQKSDKIMRDIKFVDSHDYIIIMSDNTLQVCLNDALYDEYNATIHLYAIYSKDGYFYVGKEGGNRMSYSGFDAQEIINNYYFDHNVGNTVSIGFYEFNSDGTINDFSAGLKYELDSFGFDRDGAETMYSKGTMGIPTAPNEPQRHNLGPAPDPNTVAPTITGNPYLISDLNSIVIPSGCYYVFEQGCLHVTTTGSGATQRKDVSFKAKFLANTYVLYYQLDENVQSATLNIKADGVSMPLSMSASNGVMPLAFPTDKEYEITITVIGKNLTTTDSIFSFVCSNVEDGHGSSNIFLPGLTLSPAESSYCFFEAFAYYRREVIGYYSKYLSVSQYSSAPTSGSFRSYYFVLSKGATLVEIFYDKDGNMCDNGAYPLEGGGGGAMLWGFTTKENQPILGVNQDIEPKLLGSQMSQNVRTSEAVMSAYAVYASAPSLRVANFRGPSQLSLKWADGHTYTLTQPGLIDPIFIMYDDATVTYYCPWNEQTIPYTLPEVTTTTSTMYCAGWTDRADNTTEVDWACGADFTTLYSGIHTVPYLLPKGANLYPIWKEAIREVGVDVFSPNDTAVVPVIVNPTEHIAEFSEFAYTYSGGGKRYTYDTQKGAIALHASCENDEEGISSIVFKLKFAGYDPETGENPRSVLSVIRFNCWLEDDEHVAGSTNSVVDIVVGGSAATLTGSTLQAGNYSGVVAYNPMTYNNPIFTLREDEAYTISFIFKERMSGTRNQICYIIPWIKTDASTDPNVGWEPLFKQNTSYNSLNPSSDIHTSVVNHSVAAIPGYQNSTDYVNGWKLNALSPVDRQNDENNIVAMGEYLSYKITADTPERAIFFPVISDVPPNTTRIILNARESGGYVNRERTLQYEVVYITRGTNFFFKDLAQPNVPYYPKGYKDFNQFWGYKLTLGNYGNYIFWDDGVLDCYEGFIDDDGNWIYEGSNLTLFADFSEGIEIRVDLNGGTVPYEWQSKDYQIYEDEETGKSYYSIYYDGRAFKAYRDASDKYASLEMPTRGGCVPKGIFLTSNNLQMVSDKGKAVNTSQYAIGGPFYAEVQWTLTAAQVNLDYSSWLIEADSIYNPVVQGPVSMFVQRQGDNITQGYSNALLMTPQNAIPYSKLTAELNRYDRIDMVWVVEGWYADPQCSDNSKVINMTEGRNTKMEDGVAFLAGVSYNGIQYTDSQGKWVLSSTTNQQSFTLYAKYKAVPRDVFMFELEFPNLPDGGGRVAYQNISYSGFINDYYVEGSFDPTSTNYYSYTGYVRRENLPFYNELNTYKDDNDGITSTTAKKVICLPQIVENARTSVTYTIETIDYNGECLATVWNAGVVVKDKDAVAYRHTTTTKGGQYNFPATGVSLKAFTGYFYSTPGTHLAILTPTMQKVVCKVVYNAPELNASAPDIRYVDVCYASFVTGRTNITGTYENDGLGWEQGVVPRFGVGASGDQDNYLSYYFRTYSQGYANFSYDTASYSRDTTQMGFIENIICCSNIWKRKLTNGNSYTEGSSAWNNALFDFYLPKQHSSYVASETYYGLLYDYAPYTISGGAYVKGSATYDTVNTTPINYLKSAAYYYTSLDDAINDANYYQAASWAFSSSYQTPRGGKLFSGKQYYDKLNIPALPLSTYMLNYYTDPRVVNYMNSELDYHCAEYTNAQFLKGDYTRAELQLMSDVKLRFSLPDIHCFLTVKGSQIKNSLTYYYGITATFADPVFRVKNTPYASFKDLYIENDGPAIEFIGDGRVRGESSISNSTLVSRTGQYTVKLAVYTPFYLNRDNGLSANLSIASSVIVNLNKSPEACGVLVIDSKVVFVSSNGVPTAMNKIMAYNKGVILRAECYGRFVASSDLLWGNELAPPPVNFKSILVPKLMTHHYSYTLAIWQLNDVVELALQTRLIRYDENQTTRALYNYLADDTTFNNYMQNLPFTFNPAKATETQFSIDVQMVTNAYANLLMTSVNSENIPIYFASNPYDSRSLTKITINYATHNGRDENIAMYCMYKADTVTFGSIGLQIYFCGNRKAPGSNYSNYRVNQNFVYVPENTASVKNILTISLKTEANEDLSTGGDICVRPTAVYTQKGGEVQAQKIVSSSKVLQVEKYTDPNGPDFVGPLNPDYDWQRLIRGELSFVVDKSEIYNFGNGVGHFVMQFDFLKSFQAGVNVYKDGNTLYNDTLTVRALAPQTLTVSAELSRNDFTGEKVLDGLNYVGFGVQGIQYNGELIYVSQELSSSLNIVGTPVTYYPNLLTEWGSTFRLFVEDNIGYDSSVITDKNIPVVVNADGNDYECKYVVTLYSYEVDVALETNFLQIDHNIRKIDVVGTGAYDGIHW